MHSNARLRASAVTQMEWVCAQRSPINCGAQLLVSTARVGPSGSVGPAPGCNRAVWCGGARARRPALVNADDDEALDREGDSTYPDGSDLEDPSVETVWWVNQEALQQGAGIELLGDLYRFQQWTPNLSVHIPKTFPHGASASGSVTILPWVEMPSPQRRRSA